MPKFAKPIHALLFLAIAVVAVSAQNKKNQKPEPTPMPVEEPAKRNDRPAPTVVAAQASRGSSTHFYEFLRPGFNYGHILIEHDDAGKGKIAFLKDGFEELLTDPIDLSAGTMNILREALAELKFLDSTEEYQHIRDYSHMGNVTFTLRLDGRSRTVKYNWTDNKPAKVIMDEYRRITNEYTWRFELTLAIQNFPLQTPALMDLLDAYIKRGEISDPPHLLPFVGALSNDERMPLMARNRAVKIVKEIEKRKK